MEAKRLNELLVKLRNELGRRASNEYLQLFGPSTIRKLSRLIEVAGNHSDRFRDNTLLRVMNAELVDIFKDAGIAIRTNVRDSVGSLTAIRDIIAEINDAANSGAFGGHEVTYLTNDIKAWLSRDIEHLQAILGNRPWNS